MGPMRSAIWRAARRPARMLGVRVRRSGSNGPLSHITDRRLTQAYATNLAHRLPLLYCVVLFNVVVLTLSFASLAPVALTLVLPVLLVSALLSRALYWLPRRVAERPASKMRSDLRRLKMLLIGAAGESRPRTEVGAAFRDQQRRAP